jgi:hypothetical protein
MSQVQVQLTEHDKAFLQTIEYTKIAFSIVKHFAEVAAKHDTNKHTVVNLDYTMKFLYEQLQRMEMEWQKKMAMMKPDTPLQSTVNGIAGLTAEEAQLILKLRYQKEKQK